MNGGESPLDRPRPPRLLRALTLDPWAARLAVCAATLLAMSLFLRLFGYGALAHLKYLYVAGLGGLTLLALGARLWALRAAFARALLVKATIAEARYEGGHRLRLRYRHDGEEREAGLHLALPRRHAWARGWVEGAEVELAVDLKEPSRVFLAAPYGALPLEEGPPKSS